MQAGHPNKIETSHLLERQGEHVDQMRHPSRQTDTVSNHHRHEQKQSQIQYQALESNEESKKSKAICKAGSKEALVVAECSTPSNLSIRKKLGKVGATEFAKDAGNR